MKTLYLAAAAASLALCACSSTGYGYHDAIKLQAAGLNMNGNTGVSAGYMAATVDRVANVDKNGKPITVGGPCSREGNANIFDTYANLNSKASAQATSVIPAGPAAGAAAAGGVNNPQIAWASGDVTANGEAAFIASTVATGHPADTIAALCGNPLPSAPGGSIVRDGVAPK